MMISIFNAYAGLISRLLKFSYISLFMVNQLHWLPLSAPIQFKSVYGLLVQTVYCSEVLQKSHSPPLSAASHRPLYGHIEMTMAQTRSISSHDPPFWVSFHILILPQNLFQLSGFSHW